MRRLLLAPAIILFATVALAQPEPDRYPVTLGASFGPTAEGLSHIGVVLAVQKGPLVVSGRYLAIELEHNVPIGPSQFTDAWASEGALLGGVAVPVGWGWQATALAGVSAIQVRRYETSVFCDGIIFCSSVRGRQGDSPAQIGLPLEMGVHKRVSGALVLGVRAFGTLNTNETFGGAALDVRLHPRRGRQPK